MTGESTETSKLTQSKHTATLPWLVLFLCTYANMEAFLDRTICVVIAGSWIGVTAYWLLGEELASLRTATDGIASNLIGTTLPELQTFFHSSLKVMSVFFLAHGVSLILGNLLTPVLLKFCEMNLIMAATRVIQGVALFLCVMTPYAGMAGVCFALIGFCNGLAATTSWLLCQLLFPHKMFVFHVIAMGMSVGGVLGPLIAEPFVSDVKDNSHYAHNGTGEAVGTDNSSSGRLCSQRSSSSMTFLKYIYCIFALLSLPSFVGFVGISLRTKIFLNSPFISQNTKTENENRGIRLAFTILILFMFFSNYAVAYVHGSYITTVAEKGHLKISAERATGMTSVFWFMMFIGRLCGTAMSMFLRQVIIMWICFIGCIVSILLLISSVYQSGGIYYWVGSFLLGLFAGPQCPAMMNWSKQYIALTPFIMALYNGLSYTGSTTLSFVGGQLIVIFGESSEPYFCLTFEVSKLLLLCLAQIVGKFVQLRREDFNDLNNP